MRSSHEAKERSPPAANWAAACSHRGQRGAGGRQRGGKVCLAREQEVAVSREPFAELSSWLPGSYYQHEAAVNVLSVPGTWELRVQLN